MNFLFVSLQLILLLLAQKSANCREDNILSRIIDNAVLHPIQQITSKKWGRDLKEANKKFGSEMHQRLDPLIYTAPRQTLNRVKVVSFAGAIFSGINCYRSKKTMGKVIYGAITSDYLRVSYNCFLEVAENRENIPWKKLPEGTLCMGVIKTFQKLNRIIIASKITSKETENKISVKGSDRKSSLKGNKKFDNKHKQKKN